MPVDPSYAGRVYPPSAPYELGREKIREFADAIGDPHPAYREPAVARALGHSDVIAPPTFAVVLVMRAAEAVFADPGLGLDYSRVVHREQKFVHERAMTAGDQLTVTMTVESVRTVAGNDIVAARGDVTDAAGAPVCAATITLVSRAAEVNA